MNNFGKVVTVKADKSTQKKANKVGTHRHRSKVVTVKAFTFKKANKAGKHRHLGNFVIPRVAMI